ncbi:MAG: hypothetical protein WAX80_02790 [Minisyncoccia bacterium]
MFIVKLIVFALSVLFASFCISLVYRAFVVLGVPVTDYPFVMVYKNTYPAVGIIGGAAWIFISARFSN